MVAAGVAGFAGSAAAQAGGEAIVDADGSGDYTSIQDAINTEGADSTITVNESSTGYDGFVVNKSNVTVQAAQSDTPVINGSAVSIGIGKTYAQVDANNATVQGLTITNVSTVPSQKNFVLVVSRGVSDSTVSNNIIQPGNNNHGVYVDGGGQSNVSISENVINGSGTPALMYAEGNLSANPASGVDVLDNTFIGSTNTDRALGHEVNDSTISGNAFTQVDVSIDVFGEVVNGESEPNAQRRALISQNDVAGTTVQIGSVGSGASESTDDVVDEAAQINVSVSSPNGVDESTIDVSVTGAGSTTDLVVNGTATDNVTATGSNATFDNDANDSVENINVTAQLPEDKTGYDIDVSADDTTGTTISNTFDNAFTVDMAGDALQVTADSNNAFANTDGDAPAADETANVSVTAIDRFGNELNVSDGNINVNSSDIALTSQDGSVSINGPTSGNATRNNPTTFNVSDTEVETVTLTALDTNATDETLTRNSTEQTFVAGIAGLNVTTDDSTLPADDSTEAAVTAQLVDSNGDPVPRGGISVSYSIDNSSAAGVGTPDGQSDTTNSNGAATINITADTAGELVTVTGIDQGTGNGFTGETQIETIPGEVSVDDSEFRLNGNLATPANDPEVQVATDHNVSVRVEDNSTNPIAGQDVTYTLNGTELATVPSNDQGFANVTDITLPEEKGEFVLNASAGAFNASATGTAQVNITTTAAEITELQFGSDQQTTFAADSGSNTVTIEAADQFGNVNNTSSGTVTFESGDTDVFDFGGSASDTADFSGGTATLSNLNAGSSSGQTTISATIPDSNIQNTTATFTVGEPTGINVTFTNAVSTSSNSNTNDTATLQAQLTSGGSNIGVGDETVSFARISGSAAELNQSGQSFEAETDDTGLATFQVNATSSTGQTTFLAQSENFSASGEGTITTTGAASTVNVAAENSTVTANETTNLTVSFVDSEGRIVPRIDNIGLSADLGTVEDPTNPETSFNSAGEATASTSYNATGGAGEATIQGLGGGVAGSTTITVEEVAEDAPADFEVSDLEPQDATVDVGEAFDVSATIENTGDLQGQQDIELLTEPDNGSVLATESNVSLDAGANTTVTFENVTVDTAGEFNHTVASANDSATGNLTVEEAAEDAPANFSVSGLEPQDATVNVSEAFDVSATVENTGDLQGEQEIELRLEPDGDAVRNQTVSLDAGNSTTVTFDNVTVDTAGEFNHTVASANDSATGSLTVEQREQEQEPPTATVTFENQTVQNGSTTVNVASATFNGSEAFNIVVHQASDDNDDGTIQASEIGQKIGESEALEPGSEPRTNITVNISKQVADNDNVSQLTENETLVAMLHTTNTSDDDSIVHTAPITRDGTRVFDQADIGIEPESPLDGPAARFDENADGEIDIGELGQAGRAFAAGDLSITELGQVGRIFAR